MPTKSQYRAGNLVFYDDKNLESVVTAAALIFGDDFTGAGHSAIPTAATVGYPWGRRNTNQGAATVLQVANAVGGQIALTLASTSGKRGCESLFCR